MKISYMILVFNAVRTLPKGMLEANIRRIYEDAHEIFIIEGASREEMLIYTSDGRSTDGTIELINELKKDMPKIKLIQNQNFWNGKDEMCKSIAGQVTGDYIFQLDSDEFYHEDEISIIFDLLEKRQPYAMYFYAYHFWGDFFHCIDEKTGKNWANMSNKNWGRIFKNSPEKSLWIAHRPPTYQYEEGIICNDQENIINADETLEAGIHLYHYSYVIREQAEFKDVFYNNKEFSYKELWDKWQQDHDIPLVYGDHTRIFDAGKHPIAIQTIL